MNVRAKFFVRKCELDAHNKGGKVILSAVSRGDRNAEWAKASPAGTIEMQIDNAPAFEWFFEMVKAAQGTDYKPEVFVDFTAATDGFPGDGHTFRLADVPADHYLAGKCGECGVDKDAKWGSDETLAHPNG